MREFIRARRRLDRRQLTEAAGLYLRHQRKGLPWEPSDFGFVFSKEQIERHAQHLMRHHPALYAANPGLQAGPPPAQPKSVSLSAIGSGQPEGVKI